MIQLRWLKREVQEKPDSEPFFGEFLQYRNLEATMVNDWGDEQHVFTKWQDVPTVTEE
jgi:hypothetical protein